MISVKAVILSHLPQGRVRAAPNWHGICSVNGELESGHQYSDTPYQQRKVSGCGDNSLAACGHTDFETFSLTALQAMYA
jgi:hypothetical protein